MIKRSWLFHVRYPYNNGVSAQRKKESERKNREWKKSTNVKNINKKIGKQERTIRKKQTDERTNECKEEREKEKKKKKGERKKGGKGQGKK